MFILKLLGGASLEGPDGPVAGRASQKRRLAALALLAMSRRTGLSREKLVAILWPESDEERGRHLLSDTIYVINRALGGEVVVGAADELRLAADRLSCDARAFEEAVEQGALDEAVRLYTGPFLDAFSIDGSEEFEGWMAAERLRLQRLFERALEQLAERRAGRGDLPGAVECWRRLGAEDPFNSRIAAGLALALERAGDRAGALQHARTHADLLKRELGLAPPEEILTVVRALRAAPPPEAPASAPDVSPDPLAASGVEGTASPVGVEPSAEGPRPPRRSPARLAAVLVAALLVAAGVRAFWPRPAASVTARTLQSVAVMPFDDLSPARDQEYFSHGISEELSTRLARVPGLKVVARTSAFAFKDANADARRIGRALNVDALLEGSVRQAADQVRIAVRLVDAGTGYQIWADSWAGAGADVLTLQDEIAGGVLRALRGGQAEAAVAGPRRTIDPAAYDLYLKGRYLWHQRTRDSLTRAGEAFDRAVSLAPDFAEAHSGVADAYAVLGFYDYLPPHDAFPRARQAAAGALARSRDLAEPHASLGYVALYYDWNWPEAERAFRRAIELNPSYSIGHQWYANFLVARGRFDEAVAAMRRAQEVDPLSLIASAALGWAQYYRRDFDAAAEQCRRTLELNPKFEQAWLWGGWAHEAAGRYDEAREMLRMAASLSGRSAIALTALGRVEALAGDLPAARAVVGELEREHARYLPAYEMARLHVGLGDRAEALRWLQRAFDQRSHSIVFLGVDPQLDPLRGDPAFVALVERLDRSARETDPAVR